MTTLDLLSGAGLARHRRRVDKEEARGLASRTLPLVARYADASNLPQSPDVPLKLDLLRRLCEEFGRDYAAIEKTAPFGFDVGEDGSKADEVIGQLRNLAEQGIQTVIGWVVGMERLTPIEVMERTVIPAVAELEAVGAARA